MSKKLILGATLALIFALSLTGATAFADDDDGIMPINETHETNPINETGDTNEDIPTHSTTGEISEPTDETNSDEKIDLDEGNMIPEDAPADDEEEESEPEMWPMYVSLGALGAAVLIFIILNLFGRKKR